VRCSSHLTRCRAALRGVICSLALTAAPLATTPLVAQDGAADSVPRSARPFFTRSDAITLGAFTIATIAITPADRYFAERLQRPRVQGNQFLRRGAAVVREVAEPGTILIGGTLYAVGRLAGNERMARVGLHGTEAVLIGLGTVAVGKVVTGRARPYATGDTNARDFKLMRGLRGGTDYQSFPSGHTVMAFAAAAAVTGETARWWPDATPYIGTALYGGAALAGVSRMYNDKHWASDVLVGAAIGTVVGQKVVRYHRTHPNSRIDRWFLSATLVPTATGGRLLKLAIVPGFR
jgi:membrane-associated phospholipid phosphatase